jgi:anti-sigma B factor antagonist
LRRRENQRHDSEGAKTDYSDFCFALASSGKFSASQWQSRCYNRSTDKEELSVALAIASREVDGVTVLDLSGRITLGEGSVQLRDAIRDLIGKGQRRILLDLGDVNYIDSSGLGELVSAYTTAKNQGATLKLLKLTKKVHDLLQLTKLYTVFDIYDDEASGIASFK